MNRIAEKLLDLLLSEIHAIITFVGTVVWLFYHVTTIHKITWGDATLIGLATAWLAVSLIAGTLACPLSALPRSK